MSKGIKKVLKVAAVVAIPFVAPVILPAIASSGFLGAATTKFLGTTLGSTLGSAALSAGLGGIAGGKKGALQGALAGGLSGLAVGLSGGAGAAGAGAGAGTTGAGAGTAGAGTAGGGGWSAMTSAGSAGAGTAGGGGWSAMTSAGSAANAAAAPASIGSKIMAAAGNIGKSLGLTDPGMLGRAAMFLASGAIASGTRPDNPILDQYVRRLQELQGQDNQLFQQTMQIAQQNLAEANAVDPTGEGMRAANEAKIQTVAAGQQALENVPQNQVGLRMTGQRQYYTDAARNQAAAFTQGSEMARSRKATQRNAAFAGVQVPTNRWGDAVNFERQRNEDESGRAAGTLSTLKYIFNPQVPAGGGTGGGTGGTGGEGGKFFSDLWSGITSPFKTTKPEEATV